jgi:hypothetical protein
MTVDTPKNRWWLALPSATTETPYDLCGDCGVSRDLHPRNGCAGVDWRVLGFVGIWDGRPTMGHPNVSDPPWRPTPGEPHYMPEKVDSDGDYIWWFDKDHPVPSDYKL